MLNSMKRSAIAVYEKIYASAPVLNCLYRRMNAGHRLRILSPLETIRYIREHHCSIARFGDGEFELILQPDRDLGFQDRSQALSAQLQRVLCMKDDRVLICIPTALNSIRGRTKHSKLFWFNWCRRNHQHHRIVELIRTAGGNDYLFGDSQITRSYIAFKNHKNAGKLFGQIRKLWDDKDILIVEGQSTHLGIGNDLLDNARSVKRILCPATNAFGQYEKILAAVKQAWGGELVLLALGPAATVLAADLGTSGIQALDIGHVDIEYEWFLRGATGHDVVPGKFTNEAAGGGVVTDCTDPAYLSQIIAAI